MEHYLFASGAAACACLVLRASRATRNRDDRRRHTTDPPIDHIASAAVDLVDALRGQGERFAFTGRVLHYDCQSGALLEVLRGTHGGVCAHARCTHRCGGARGQVAMLLAEDPQPLRTAKITQAAATRKQEKLTVVAELARAAAGPAT